MKQRDRMVTGASKSFRPLNAAGAGAAHRPYLTSDLTGWGFGSLLSFDV